MITTTSPDRLEHIAVLGLGRSGNAAARLAYESGIDVCVFDDNATPSDLPAELPATCWHDASEWDFSKIDALILSPGIPHHHPEPHPVAAAAIAANIPILSDIELVIRLQAPSKWVIITGTNGKSTTTALIGHILSQAGIDNIAGGNLGPALAGFASPGASGVRVVEMSSYQLERTPSLQADAAVILNITPDHLDRHGGMDGYIAAKEQAISNLKSDGICFLGSGDALDKLARAYPACQRLYPEKVPLSARNNPGLQGAHNLENIAAAIDICEQLGVAEADCLGAIQTFGGLAHRLQPCGNHGDIQFINDSKATNGEAASKALAAFDDIYWLAGGIAKDDGLEACLPYADRIITAYFYGQDAARFVQESTGKIQNQSFETMQDALKAAYQDAQNQHKSGTILLSPAAASFDQFSSFEARGDSFMELVSSLAALQPATSDVKEVSHA